MIFVLFIVTALTVAGLYGPEKYEYIYFITASVIGVWWIVTKLTDHSSDRHFTITASSKDEVTHFYLHDNFSGTEYELKVVESFDMNSCLVPSYDSLTSLTYQDHRFRLGTIGLIQLLVSLDESERSSVTDQFLNLLLVLTHQKPIFKDIRYEDYTITGSAKKHLKSSLRLVI